MIDKGSLEKLSAHMGVSASFLKTVLNAFPRDKKDPLEVTAEKLERYGSIRLTARMIGQPESIVRAFVKKNNLELLLRYDFSNHNNGKGRRAETYWASLWEEGEILEDCNVTKGSQADWDYTHRTLGKVNVKSSSAHRYTSKTRKGNQWYWKISSKSLEKADTVAIVLYDSKMQTPLHVFNVKVEKEMMNCTSIRLQIEGGKLKMFLKDSK